ncbi:MAG: hypothetical protein VW397_01520 [Candidatus Margulisiibacteriota bacterium]
MPYLLWFFFVLFFISGCSKPIDSLKGRPRVALVNVNYDANFYLFKPSFGVTTEIYAPFSGKSEQMVMHETMLNEFVIDLMRSTKAKANLSIVRPLKLLNTSLMQDASNEIVYEYMLDPYDPIDINDTVFMAGLARLLDVDAVMQLNIGFAVYLDEKTLWEEYNDPYAETLTVYRMQLKQGHETSQLRTTVQMVVVDQFGSKIYDETRFVITDSDQIIIDDRDLNFDGGVSPKLLEMGLQDWLQDWVDYLPQVDT